MATITAGTGATNTATTVEASLIGDLRRLQSFERNTAKNSGGYNYVNSTSSDDDATFTASITFPVSITINNGVVAITAIDYLGLAGSDFTPGTGGTFKATTLQGSIIEKTVYQNSLEKDISKNPTGVLLINYSVTNNSLGALGNATFTANYGALPLEITENSDGTQSTKGKAYLLN